MLCFGWPQIFGKTPLLMKKKTIWLLSWSSLSLTNNFTNIKRKIFYLSLLLVQPLFAKREILKKSITPIKFQLWSLWQGNKRSNQIFKPWSIWCKLGSLVRSHALCLLINLFFEFNFLLKTWSRVTANWQGFLLLRLIPCQR